MEVPSTPPQWLETLGWISLAMAFAGAAYILFDIFVLGHRQKMWIMEVVHPVTALYFGPLAIWFYLRYGRHKSRKGSHHHRHHQKIAWHQVSEGVLHCGAGCTLGDIIAEWIVFAATITIAGRALYADFIFDFILAWSLGIIFQYFTIAPMRNISVGRALWEAVKADTISILAFQLGLFFGMYVYQELIFSTLSKTTSSYWFLMQLSMVLGFFTAYPVNKLLLKKGIKIAM
jgi:hypothetical protein